MVSALERVRSKVPTVCAYDPPSKTALLVDPGALVATSLLKVILPLSARVLPLPEESAVGFAALNFQSATVADRKPRLVRQRIVIVAVSLAHGLLTLLGPDPQIDSKCVFMRSFCDIFI